MIPKLNAQQMMAARALVGNANPYAVNQPGTIYYGGQFSSSANAKHNLYFDFGYPSIEELKFEHFYRMWRRNGFASSLVSKTGGKTWQENPTLREEQEDDSEETTYEAEIRQHFESIRFWQKLRMADERGMVGKYSAVVFQLGDGLPYNQPVERVSGGVTGLVNIFPAWEGQLKPSSWDTDPDSPTYGMPTMYLFNENAVDPEEGQVRSFTVHPDRVYIWSYDNTTWGESKLEPCYNALMDLEKIRGSGAEGFWKNAKSQPILQASPEVDFNQLAQMLGVQMDGLADALDEVVENWVRGFDQSMVLQGMEAKTLQVTLPQPEEFFNTALQEVAASWPIPQKILVGMQTGERASTEDAREWAQINMSRREGLVVPNVMGIIERLEAWGILDQRDWWLDWADLTAPTLEERLTIGEKMSKINQAMAASGELVFTDDEIRAVADYAPLEESDLSDDLDDEDLDLPEPEDG